MFFTFRTVGRYPIFTLVALFFIRLFAGEPVLPVITTGQNADGRLEVFYIKTDRICYHRWQLSPGGEWSEETPCYDSAKGVLMDLDKDECLNVFIIDQDNRLFLKQQSSPANGWYDVAELDDQVKAIDFLRDQDGTLHLFYTNLSNVLYHRWQLLPDKHWSEKQKLAQFAGAVAAGQNLDGRLEVFYSGADEIFYHKGQNAPGGAWAEENPFSGTAKHIAVSQNTDGRLEVFFIDRENVLQHRWQVAPNNGWDNPAVFADRAQFITVEKNHDGRMEVFYSDLNHILHHKWQFAPSSGWDRGEQFGWTARGMAAKQNQNGCLEAFYMDLNDTLFHNWQLKPGLHWAGEHPLVSNHSPLFTVDEFPSNPIYKTSHKNWHVNDHCFIQGKDDRWHMFGIVWPDPGSGDPTLADYFGHAVADNLNQKFWEEQPPPFHEPLTNGKVLWAPHVIRHTNIFYMFYCSGGSVESYAIALRTSDDLIDWSEPIILFRDGFQARDPMVRWCTDVEKWIMYYTATDDPAGGHPVVAYRTSNDLIQWSKREIAYTDYHSGTGYGPAESPFVVQRGDDYYLFIGPRPFDYPTESLPDWQHPGYDGTDVFRSNRWDHWENSDYVGHIAAHAPEILQDEHGDWYVSRAGILRGGLYLTRMTWLDGLDSPVSGRSLLRSLRQPSFFLQQNYPNPFNSQTFIDFTLSNHGRVFVQVTDMTGREVRVLLDEERPAGFYRMKWDGCDRNNLKVSSGIYLCRIRTENEVAGVKMIFIR
ncbi:family 43 glycosylhydrolase [candidate division KSB1 bacterium]|nr:family 43 glycosylhydrolase [candidate division KSB1 bacterium]